MLVSATSPVESRIHSDWIDGISAFRRSIRFQASVLCRRSAGSMPSSSAARSDSTTPSAWMATRVCPSMRATVRRRFSFASSSVFSRSR